jgi:uncharacterized repeat protein (TIGR01451 family)
MASDIASIGGNVFTDLTDDAVAPSFAANAGDTNISNVTVRLFRDGGNNTFDSGNDGTADPDDTLVGTDLTDAGGNYLFEDLGPGRYYIQQAAAPGRLQRPAQTLKTVVISDADSEGIGVLTIDNFTDNTAAILANSGAPTASSVTDTTGANTLGSERDLVVNHTAGGNDIDARVSAGIFSVNPGAGTSGNAILTFDGDDNDANTLTHTNLSQNLTASGAEAFQFLVGSEAGNTMTVTVHSGSGNFSTRTVPLPVTASAAPTEILTMRYSDFTLGGGTGANFSNVTAMQIQITTAASSDAQIDLNQTVRPFLSTQNFANLNPLSIGDRVWRDTDNDGTLDGGESGIQNVTVQAYLDDGDNVFDAGDTLSGSGTTNATGNYVISNLLPGNYFVVVPSSNFTGGGALVGHTASTTVQAPNTDSNNINKGAMVAGAAVTTAALTLSSAGEPTTDGDADNNSNLTLDFGFAAEMDLEIEKTVNSGTVTAGNQVTYTLTVTNNGPGVADNVLVVDNLPDFMTVTPANITATPDGTVTLTGDPAGEIEVGYASLASGATRTITIVATIPAAQAAQANVVNSASVTGDGVDSDDDNNQDTANINVVRQAVLQISKTDTPDPVLVGQALNYQIIVTNNGASTATNVEIRDTLPAGLTFTSVNATSGTPTHNAGLISLDLSTLAVGGSVTINVGTTVQSNFAGSTVANTASAEADEAAQVTAQANTAVNPQLDLQITKADSADPISAGSQLTYTLSVRNDGPSAATNVQVVDTLPADVTFVSANSTIVGATVTPPTAPSRDVTIGLGNMASGATGTITIIVTVNQNAAASLSNSAIIRSTESLAGFDTNTANNTDTETTATQRVIDLAVTKVDSATVGNPIRPGGTVTYTITATNNGPTNATLVRVTDNIPDGLQVTSATIGANPITIPASASDTNASNPDDLIFDIGNLANGASATLTVIANVLPDFRNDLLNTAVISTTEAGITETITNNNTASVTSPLSARVDVAVAKTSPSGATVIAGNALVYHIDVTNNGPSTATNVNISDTLPAGLTFGSVSSQQGTVSHANGIITGNLGTIAPNATVRVTVNTTVAAATRGNVSNTVTVTQTETDSNTQNNTSTIVTTIDPRIDVRVSKAKTNPNDPAIAGGPLTYSIIVTNDGPSTATNVVMTDVLPNGLTFTQGSSTVGNVNAAGQTVTANIGTLAPGASATITIETSVATSAAGTLSNTASVTGTETDTNTSNNSSTLNTPIAVTGSVSGLTYIDADRNGVFSSGESGVAGVTMTLTGTDILGRTVNRTATTNANGEYTFADVHPGTYTVTQTQPLGLQSLQNNVGTPAGGTAGDNLISNIVVTSGVNAVAYNFGEVPNPLSKRRFLASSDQFD